MSPSTSDLSDERRCAPVRRHWWPSRCRRACGLRRPPISPRPRRRPSPRCRCRRCRRCRPTRPTALPTSRPRRRFGATLFFDQRLSRDGTVACATCHQIDRQFQDDLPLGGGVGTTQPPHHAARRRRLRALVVLGRAARQPVVAGAGALWKTRANMPAHRAVYAHFVADKFRERYERIFGPLPDLSTVPQDAGPLGNRSANRPPGCA